MSTHGKELAQSAPAKRMFSYLDGEMNARERAAFEARLGTDRVLAAEVEAHRVLLAAMDEVAAFTPSPDFRMRVLASLHVGESWWQRLRRRVWSAASPVPDMFTEFLDEGLAPRQAGALMAFVASDPRAATTLESWRRLFRALESLPELDPSDGFAERVMARVRAPERQGAGRRAVVRSGTGLRGLPTAVRHLARVRNWVGQRWPSPREQFALTSGMAVGPVAAFLVTLHMLSGNPLLTTANVASFLEARAGATLTRLTDALSASPAANSAIRRFTGILDGWALNAPTMSAGLVLLGVLTLTSAWILYRNVIKVSQSDNRHVPS